MLMFALSVGGYPMPTAHAVQILLPQYAMFVIHMQTLADCYVNDMIELRRSQMD